LWSATKKVQLGFIPGGWEIVRLGGWE
jgi:hypothetical protein